MLRYDAYKNNTRILVINAVKLPQGDFTLRKINYHINELYKELDKHPKICHKADVINIHRGILWTSIRL